MLSFLFGFISFLDPAAPPQPGSGLDSGSVWFAAAVRGITNKCQVLMLAWGLCADIQRVVCPISSCALCSHVSTLVVFQKYCGLFSKAQPRWPLNNVYSMNFDLWLSSKEEVWTLTFIQLTYALLLSTSWLLLLDIKHQNWKSVYFLK